MGGGQIDRFLPESGLRVNGDAIGHSFSGLEVLGECGAGCEALDPSPTVELLGGSQFVAAPAHHPTIGLIRL